MAGNTVKIGKVFVRWYLVQRPAEIVRTYLSYAVAFGLMFSFVFLLKTLFAPWKGIRDAYPSKGFNPTAMMETLTLNITARAIGCIIRIFAMLIGILLQIVLLAGFSLYFFVWIFSPVIGLCSIPFLIYISF